VRARLTARARGAKALVSDERESYQPGAENAGLEHQLGLAHWRKAVARQRKPVEDCETEQQLFETALQRLDESGHRSLQWLHSQSRRARPAGGSVNPPSTPCACSLWTSWRRPLASRWEATASQRDWLTDVGNRTSKTLGGTAITYSYDDNNKLTSASGRGQNASLT